MMDLVKIIQGAKPIADLAAKVTLDNTPKLIQTLLEIEEWDKTVRYYPTYAIIHVISGSICVSSKSDVAAASGIRYDAGVTVYLDSPQEIKNFYFRNWTAGESPVVYIELEH